MKQGARNFTAEARAVLQRLFEERPDEKTFKRKGDLETVDVVEQQNGKLETVAFEYYRSQGLFPNQLTAAYLADPENFPAMSLRDGPRLLIAAGVGTGKTLTMITIFDRLFDDPRSKIAFFPKQAVRDNFYKEILKYESRWRAFLVQYFRKYGGELKDGTYGNPAIKPAQSDSAILNVRIKEIERVLALKGENGTSLLNVANTPVRWKKVGDHFKAYLRSLGNQPTVARLAAGAGIGEASVRNILDGRVGASQPVLDAMVRLINEEARAQRKRWKMETVDTSTWWPAGAIRAYTYWQGGGNRDDDPVWRAHWEKKGDAWQMRKTKAGNLSSKIVVLDEVHKLVISDDAEEESPDSSSAKHGCGSELICRKRLADKVQRAEGSIVIGLTGTPVPRSPEDAPRLLRIIKGDVNADKPDSGFVSFFMARPRELFATIENPSMQDQTVLVSMVDAQKSPVSKGFLAEYLRSRYGAPPSDEFGQADDDDDDEAVDALFEQYGDRRPMYRTQIRVDESVWKELRDKLQQKAFGSIERKIQRALKDGVGSFLEKPEYVTSEGGLYSPESMATSAQAFYRDLIGGPTVERVLKRSMTERVLVISAVPKGARPTPNDRALKLWSVARAAAADPRKSLLLIGKEHGFHAMVFLLRYLVDGEVIPVHARVLVVPFGGDPDETRAMYAQRMPDAEEHMIQQAYPAIIIGKHADNTYDVRYLDTKPIDNGRSRLGGSIERNVPRYLIRLTESKVDYMTKSDFETRRFRKLPKTMDWSKMLAAVNAQKQARFNDPKTNLRGEKITYMVLERNEYEEGVSFLHVRHIHLVDVMELYSQYIQAIGRGVRAGGHLALPVDEQTVRVSLYSLVNPIDSDNADHFTLDQKRVDDLVKSQGVLDKATCSLAFAAPDRKLLLKLADEQDACACPAGCIEQDVDVAKAFVNSQNEQKRERDAALKAEREREKRERRDVERAEDLEKSIAFKKDLISDWYTQVRAAASTRLDAGDLAELERARAASDAVLKAQYVVTEDDKNTIESDRLILGRSSRIKVEVGQTIALRELRGSEDTPLFETARTDDDARALVELAARQRRLKLAVGAHISLGKIVEDLRSLEDSLDGRKLRAAQNVAASVKLQLDALKAASSPPRAMIAPPTAVIAMSLAAKLTDRLHQVSELRNKAATAAREERAREKQAQREEKQREKTEAIQAKRLARVSKREEKEKARLSAKSDREQKRSERREAKLSAKAERTAQRDEARRSKVEKKAQLAEARAQQKKDRIASSGEPPNLDVFLVKLSKAVAAKGGDPSVVLQGWTVRADPRPLEPDHFDIFYFSPTGKRFRSRKNVLQSLGLL